MKRSDMGNAKKNTEIWDFLFISNISEILFTEMISRSVIYSDTKIEQNLGQPTQLESLACYAHESLFP